jgi:LytS/YehU family sensor histidine kinase
MLLIPFVENAFKHGISLQSPSWITVHLQCSHNELEFVVSNSIHRPGQGDPEYGKSGIGLNNITQRLKLLYPGKHNLYINQTSEKFEVKLILN